MIKKSIALQKDAAAKGFEWPDLGSARAKIEEELEELKHAHTAEDRKEEFGDLLFCVINYARIAGIDMEDALDLCHDKFQKRFDGMEKDLVAQYGCMSKAPLSAMLESWKRQK